jgi:hypothetical protein
MIAAVRMARPTVESRAPTGSSRACLGSRESGTSLGAASRAAATIGTLMRKTAVQSNCSRRPPPAAGPMPTPMPATAAQMPIAFGRSSAGKTLVRIERVVGMISAPPIPISARVAISMLADSANADASEALPKISSPATSAPRRLKRSPRAPMVRRSPAKTSV